MNRSAETDHEVHALLKERWSPYGFSDRDVSPGDLASLFEAARWAASSFNEQPWRFLVALKRDPEEFAKALSCLVEPNQAWAKAAPVLVISAARMTFTRNDKPNRVAIHDLGLAAANLTLEATARGLVVHQMGGILPERAKEVYGIPEPFEVLTALAIGYVADPSTLPEELQSRDTAPRTRRALKEFVFSSAWEKGASL